MALLSFSGYSVPDALAQYTDDLWPAAEKWMPRLGHLLEVTEAMDERVRATPGNSAGISSDIATSNTWWISRPYVQNVIDAAKAAVTNYIDVATFATNGDLSDWLANTPYLNDDASQVYSHLATPGTKYSMNLEWTNVVYRVTGTNHLTGCSPAQTEARDVFPYGDTMEDFWIRPELFDELRAIASTMQWVSVWAHNIEWQDSTGRASYVTTEESCCPDLLVPTNQNFSGLLSTNWAYSTVFGTCKVDTGPILKGERPHLLIETEWLGDDTAQGWQSSANGTPVVSNVWRGVDFKADLYAGAVQGWPRVRDSSSLL